MSKPHILVVDDEPDVRDWLRRALTRPDNDNGEPQYRVTTVPDGDSMKQVVHKEPVDLFIVDLMFPNHLGADFVNDGFNLIQWIRERSDASIIVLSGNANEIDQIESLDLGADDFIRKPTSENILKSRINARLRRREVHVGPSSEYMLHRGQIVILPGLRFEIGNRNITFDDGSNVLLSYTEHDFISALSCAKNGHLTREELNAFVLGRTAGPEDRRLDNLVNRLRRKLKDRTLIGSARGAGYRLTVSPKLIDRNSKPMETK